MLDTNKTFEAIEKGIKKTKAEIKKEEVILWKTFA